MAVVAIPRKNLRQASKAGKTSAKIHPSDFLPISSRAVIQSWCLFSHKKIRCTREYGVLVPTLDVLKALAHTKCKNMFRPWRSMYYQRNGREWHTLRISKIIFVPLVAFAIWRIGFLPSSDFYMRRPSANRTVCLVLGEMLLAPDGSASPNLLARMRTAKAVVASYDVPHVILSGGDTARVSRTEALVMKELWALDHGNLGSVDFHLETQSRSTCQNAFYSIPILSQLKAEKIILVTSDYHIPRARLLFEQVFLSAATDLSSVKMYGHGAPTQNNRSHFFENERYWLSPLPLKRLLTNMTKHPFRQPTEGRIQQAREELDILEKG